MWVRATACLCLILAAGSEAFSLSLSHAHQEKKLSLSRGFFSERSRNVGSCLANNFRMGGADQGPRTLPGIIVSKDDMLKPGESRMLDFSDSSSKKALKRARKGGDQRKDGKAGRLCMVYLDADAMAKRVLQLGPEGVEVEIVSREKSTTQSIAGDSSLSFNVEVTCIRSVSVSAKPVQLEPFIMASVSGQS